jgi:hypothetical protein
MRNCKETRHLQQSWDCNNPPCAQSEESETEDAKVYHSAHHINQVLQQKQLFFAYNCQHQRPQ